MNQPSGQTLQELGATLGVEVASDLKEYTFIEQRKQLIPYPFAKKHQVLPLGEKEGKLVLALTDPYALEAIEQVRKLCGKELIEVLVSEEVFEEALQRCYQRGEEDASSMIAGLEPVEKEAAQDEADGYDLLEDAKGAPVIRILNAILREAIQQGASDIHFEPQEKGLSIRYRIDGVLKHRHAPPLETQAQILTRLKVMAQLDIAEQRLPQDGRIKLRVGQREIDFRVSTIPCSFGERIVLRILDKSNILLGLEKIGMGPKNLKAFRSLIKVTEGIILVTGPTGSGKTTTLYSALSEVNSPEINIMTVEDPVEYKLQGIAQIGVNPKIDLTFSTGLRHILRQDPDVIMIGEIRDRETADIAIQSALTGHLVLSTLHTNDAPSAITRLVDMGLEPYLLSSTIIGVLAQRLVRKLCPTCKVPYEPTDEELLEIGLTRAALQNNALHQAKGCDDCFGTGYQGRCGIYELMTLNHDIKQTMLVSPDASQIKAVAKAAGMHTLKDEGAALVARGITTTTEVLRVCRGGE